MRGKEEKVRREKSREVVVSPQGLRNQSSCSREGSHRAGLRMKGSLSPRRL